MVFGEQVMPRKRGYYWVQIRGDQAAQPVFWDPQSRTIMGLWNATPLMLEEMGEFAISDQPIPRTRIAPREAGAVAPSLHADVGGKVGE